MPEYFMSFTFRKLHPSPVFRREHGGTWRTEFGNSKTIFEWDLDDPAQCEGGIKYAQQFLLSELQRVHAETGRISDVVILNYKKLPADTSGASMSERLDENRMMEALNLIANTGMDAKQCMQIARAALNSKTST